MDFPEFIYFDKDSPYAELIESMILSVNIKAVEFAGEWNEGRLRIIGLTKENAEQYTKLSLRPGPLVFVTSEQDLALSSVLLAASLAESYILTTDQSGAFLASMLASIERWNTLKEKEEQKNALKAALEEKDVLLNELKHRIKNTLTIIESLLSLAQNKINDKKALTVFEDSRTRVQAMAVVYDQLIFSNSQFRINLKDYLRELCHSFETACNLNCKNIFEMDIPDIETDTKTAINLGLIVNEALTNIYKYGVQEGKKLKIALKIIENIDTGSIKLYISDNGPGLADNFSINSSTGLGMLLIQALSKQLGADFKYFSSPNRGLSLEFSGIIP